jgi:proprotein convertase subtilisin/kexin type 5
MTCVANTTASNQCLTCQANLFKKLVTQTSPLSSSPGTCISDCGDNFYGVTNNTNPVSIPWLCSPCHANCLRCNGNLQTNCTSCPSLKYFKETTKECLTSCTGAFYPLETPIKMCKACHSSCDTCTGPNINQCSSCSGTKYKTSLNTCVSTCPTNTFASQNPNECKNCHDFCATCTSNAQNSCSVCRDGFYLIPDQNKCDTTCPDGYQKNETNKRCVKCAADCKTCELSDITKCKSCYSGKYLSNF